MGEVNKTRSVYRLPWLTPDWHLRGAGREREQAFRADNAPRVDVHELVVVEQGHCRELVSQKWRAPPASVSSSAGKPSAGGGTFPKKDQGRRRSVSSASRKRAPERRCCLYGGGGFRDVVVGSVPSCVLRSGRATGVARLILHWLNNGFVSTAIGLIALVPAARCGSTTKPEPGARAQSARALAMGRA
jgi:hypothetical protein